MINETIINEITKQYATPVYVFDAEEAVARVRAIRDILGDIKLCYSIKANPFLINTLSDEVVYFEVCSPGELAICKAVCVAPEKIIYSGVHKDAWDIREAIQYGVAYVTAESIRHYELICDAAASLGKNVNVLPRLTCGNQFGMSEEDLEIILSKNHPNITIKGIHYFAGTGRRKIEKQQAELKMLTEKLESLREKYGMDLPMLEYGPGLPYPYFTDEDRSDTLAPLKALEKSLHDTAKACTLSVEMGRFIASSCGYFITSICDVKRDGDAVWCITDGGINHINYFGQMMGMKVPVIRHYRNGVSVDEKEAAPCTVCGSLCTTNDILVRSLPLDRPRIGDILVFENTGAYSVTEAMGLFLSRTLPRIVLHDGGKLTLLRDRLETWTINTTRQP